MHDSKNAYEMLLLAELNISLVFNILDLTKYYEGGDVDEVVEVQWIIPTTSLATKEIEGILGNHVVKIKRNITYEEYLVKWKGRLVGDSSWLAREEVKHLGCPLNT